jgi:RNA polymerase sigma factor (sigma-70 family)
MAWFQEAQKTAFRKALQRFIQHNDEDAKNEISEIFEQARQQMERFAQRRYSLSQEDAQDIVGGALLNAISDQALQWLWENYGGQADPEIYLQMHLRNAVSKQQPSGCLSLEELSEQGGKIPAPSLEDSVLKRLDRKIFWQTIQKCLNNGLDFQILWLRYWWDFDLRRIADLLCISHENARQRSHYAITELTQCLELLDFVRGG